MASIAEKVQNGFQKQLSDTKLLDCMRCGFCLPACPTYIHSNFDETQSPRGRIALMKAVRDGDIPFDDSVEESLDLCLGCRACEPACPAGVEYGDLLENALDVIQKEKKHSLKERATRKVAFDHLFKDQTKMVKTAGLVRFYQKSGLQTLTRKTGVLSFFPDVLRGMEKVLPNIEKNNKNRVEFYPAESKSLKVAFFTGCMMDTIFQKTNESTVQLLQEMGCDVWVPKGQVCCGALHGHSGELEKARDNARRNLDSLLNYDVDYIVNNAGGCGAFLSEYKKLLKDDQYYSELASKFSQKVIDITSLLFKLGITNLPLEVNGENNITVTYQDSCHLRNVNGVINEPREILRSINNVHFIEMKDADQCCGSAGIYNLIHSDMSMKILDNKMEDVKETSTQLIITSNPGCLLQMKLGIERAGLTKEMKALHIVDFLAEYTIKKEKFGGNEIEEEII